MSDNKELFESTKVSKAVWTLALPTIMAMLVTIIYNVADTFFIGQTGDSNQVAAISLAMPVFMIMMSFGSLFGTGGSTTISRNLGEGREKRVKNLSSFSLYASLITGIVLGLFLYVFVYPVTSLLGGSPETTEFVVRYLRWMAIGTPFVIISNAFGSIVRSDGNAKAALAGMLIGTVINIILDPIMILALDMGVSGAAVATVTGNIFATAYYLIYINRGKTVLSIKPGDFRVHGSIAGDVLTIGFPGSLSSLFMSFAIMFLNIFLAGYGDSAVAAMGVATKGNQIPAMLYGGFTMGAQPLLAYAYGAKNKARLTELIRYCLMFCVVVGVVFSLLIIAIAPWFIRGFINSPDVITQGTIMLRAMMSTNAFLGIFFLSTTILQAMGKAGAALILTISRQGFVFIPALFISNYFFGLSGLIWAQPVADVFSVVLGLYLLRNNLKAMDGKILTKSKSVPAYA